MTLFIENIRADGVRDFLDGKIRRVVSLHDKWTTAIPGDLVVFKENYWRRSYWENGEVVRGLSVENDVRYHATSPRPVARDGHEEFWEFRESIYLPEFAWRLFARVERVRPSGSGVLAEIKRVPVPTTETLNLARARANERKKCQKDSIASPSSEISAPKANSEALGAAPPS